MITATGMIATLYAYALREIRAARIKAMRNYIARVYCEVNRGRPYEWGGVDSE